MYASSAILFLSAAVSRKPFYNFTGKLCTLYRLYYGCGTNFITKIYGTIISFINENFTNLVRLNKGPSHQTISIIFLSSFPGLWTNLIIRTRSSQHDWSFHLALFKHLFPLFSCLQTWFQITNPSLYVHEGITQKTRHLFSTKSTNISQILSD